MTIPKHLSTFYNVLYCINNKRYKIAGLSHRKEKGTEQTIEKENLKNLNP